MTSVYRSPITDNRLLSLLRHLQPPRILRFTKLGVGVVLFAFGIGLAAMNTGNNLLYMIFGMILAFITASGIISELSLKGLELDWILPQEFYPEKPAIIRIILRNMKKRFPSFGIDVTMQILPLNLTPQPHPPHHIGCGTSLLPPSTQLAGRQGEKEGMRVGERFNATFISISAKSHEYADISFVPKKRGKYQIRQVQIETNFPFGFFRKSFLREIQSHTPRLVEPPLLLIEGNTPRPRIQYGAGSSDTPATLPSGMPLDKGEFIVYPKIEPIPELVFRSQNLQESQPIPIQGQGDSFWGMKEFQAGENPRLISWKNSAKAGKLLMIETEKETEQKLWLSLEPIEEWKKLSAAELESAVSFAASYVMEKFRRGFSVGLISREVWIAPPKDKRTLQEILKVLALFEPHLASDPARRESLSPPCRLDGLERADILSLWRTYKNG